MKEARIVGVETRTHTGNQARKTKSAILPSTGSSLTYYRACFRYKDSEKTLLIGEGNFSFTNALLRLFDGNGFGLHATAYDTEEIVLQKYPDAAEIIEEVYFLFY